jgi:probable F420-dependent oxidoreductase
MAEQRATLGVQPHMTDQTLPILEIARIVADRGYESIFLCEHTHIPVNSASYSPRGFLPEWTKRIPDPLISLAAVAASTSLEIGTAVALPAEHEPISYAKQIATLDALSNGRFVLGVGWGWNREEFEACTGLPANKRVPVLKDKLGLLRAVWRDDEAEYQGEYASTPPTWSWPKPARPGGPPVLLGIQGNDKNYRRIAEWADGWIPMVRGLLEDPEVADQIAECRRVWADAGRDPASLDITMLQPPVGADEIRKVLDRADELGVRRVLVQVWAEDMPRFEELMDAAAVPAGTR